MVVAKDYRSRCMNDYGENRAVASATFRFVDGIHISEIRHAAMGRVFHSILTFPNRVVQKWCLLIEASAQTKKITAVSCPMAEVA